MWLLADLFHDLPELGDVEKPTLVFFFDEAHLLFDDASDAFLDQIAQTVRLIRSKGVGVFFVTQSPTDVPDDVLAQLGSRIQHQLRAHTPNDAKALKATVNTYPNSGYADLGEVLTSLGIGEAVVTVMNERGAPTPVAWTRLRAPESRMGPADPDSMAATVAASPRHAKYAETVDRESAREKLAAKLEEGARKAAEEAADAAGAEGAAQEGVRAEGTEAAEGRRRSRRATRRVGCLQGLHAHRRPRDRARHVQVRETLADGGRRDDGRPRADPAAEVPLPPHARHQAVGRLRGLLPPRGDRRLRRARLPRPGRARRLHAHQPRARRS